MKTIDPAALPPERKAQLIYQQVRNDMAERLWQAALGNADARREEAAAAGPGKVTGLAGLLDPQPSALAAQGGFERLMTLLGGNDARPGAGKSDPSAAPLESGTRARGGRSAQKPERQGVTQALKPLAPTGEAIGTSETDAGGPLALGANGVWRRALERAGQRTGIPLPALAAIVDAEAAKNGNGQWVAWSRNPRSSAAGLGQFLAGTWIHEAQRAGTWLNETARANGWLDANGRVLGDAKGKLLALRYDGEASIHATADYARANLHGLEKAGISPGGNVGQIARAAYLGHHLGIGDATKFLRGGLSEGRARQLLIAQVGNERASRDIAQSGEAALAHRKWLTGYLDRKVRPDRFVG